MIHEWELYSVKQDVDPELARRNTEQAMGMVTWMRTLDLSPRGPIATDESTEAHDCEEIRKQSHGRNSLNTLVIQSVSNESHYRNCIQAKLSACQKMLTGF